MDIILWIMLITFISGAGGTGLGGVISSFIKNDSEKIVSLLLSFAGGVMLSVVCFDLIEQSLFPSNNLGSPQHLWLLILSVSIGFCVVWMLNHIIDKTVNPEVPHINSTHPRTADNLNELYHIDHLHVHKKSKSHLFSAGIIMALAIALHNMPEGMVIGAAYVGYTKDAVFSGTGLLMAIVIGLHNIPEGMAVAVPLIAGGMDKKRAVAVTALSGVPTIIGAVIGYLLGSLSKAWSALALGFASGAMLYVIFGELLPESILMWRSKKPAAAILVGMLCGLVIIYA